MSKNNILTFDVGASFVRMAIINRQGEISNYQKINTEKIKYSDFTSELIKLTYKLTRKELKSIEGISVGLPGTIDSGKGLWLRSPNLPYKNVYLALHLEEYFEKPVKISNDANSAACGEKLWGKAKETNSFLYLTFSSGIGGAAFHQGKIVTTSGGNGIEAGHLEISSDYRLPCGCGGINHWESYVSGFNTPNFLKTWAGKNHLTINFDGSDVYKIFQAINAGDSVALQFFEAIMKIHNQGIDFYYQKFQPEIILIGGSIYLNNQKLFDSKLEKANIIKPATFGDEASLVGAAAAYII